jgi:hypothetical protein
VGSSRGRRRTEFVGIWLLPEEKEALDRAAQIAGTSMGAAVRASLAVNQVAALQVQNDGLKHQHGRRATELATETGPPRGKFSGEGDGLLLDGIATDRGDRSRGARYNSAVRYLAMPDRGPTVILLVSEDKMINLLPDSPRRISRRRVQELLKDLREAAAAVPGQAEDFYTAYRKVEANAFYLSQAQIDEVNQLMDDYSQRRTGGAGSIRVIQKPLQPNPDMDDSFFLD